MPKALVYSRFEGGVAVCSPTEEAMTTMTGRGGYWDEHPRSFLDELVYRKTSAELQRGHHISNDAAWRFIRAMQYGGLSISEAYEVIAEHDCSRLGHLIELRDTDELPGRWFRDAWRRSKNGGPVGVDLEQAKPIQLGRIAAAVERKNRLVNRISFFGLRPKSYVNWTELALAVNRARDVDELLKIWPDGMSA